LLNKQIIILLISFCPPLLFMLVLNILRKYQLKKNRAPFTDNFLRSPGESLFNQIQDLNEKISNSLMEFVLFPVFVTVFFFSTSDKISNINFAIVICFIFIFLIYYSWKTLKLIKKRRLLRLGYDGEVAAGQELNQLMLDGYNIYHDFPADKFNIDHIVVGPDSVYAVETKARSKPRAKGTRENHRVISNGRTLQFPDYSSSNFIDQADQQAKWLQKWLNSAVGEAVKVKPIVLLPGWYVERSSPDGVPVLNPKWFANFFPKKKRHCHNPCARASTISLSKSAGILNLIQFVSKRTNEKVDYDSNSHIMRWSLLKKKVEDNFADSVVGRVEVYNTRYRKAHDEYGEVWVIGK
jgi:hypothetical protein